MAPRAASWTSGPPVEGNTATVVPAALALAEALALDEPAADAEPSPTERLEPVMAASPEAVGEPYCASREVWAWAAVAQKASIAIVAITNRSARTPLIRRTVLLTRTTSFRSISSRPSRPLNTRGSFVSISIAKCPCAENTRLRRDRVHQPYGTSCRQSARSSPDAAVARCGRRGRPCTEALTKVGEAVHTLTRLAW